MNVNIETQLTYENLSYILATETLWTIDKNLARHIGFREAILLNELIYQEKFAKQEGLVDDDGFFSCSQETLKQNTTFSEKVQKCLCTKLEKLHFLVTRLQGIPAHKWYKINEELYAPKQVTISLSQTSPEEGFIYVIKGEKDFFKIGKTRNLQQRLQLFDVLLPFPVTRVHSAKYQNYSQIEKELHQHFSANRINGEWFRLSESDIEFIKNYKINVTV